MNQPRPRKPNRRLRILKEYTLNEGDESDKKHRPQPCPHTNEDRRAQQNYRLRRLQTVKQGGEILFGKPPGVVSHFDVCLG